MISAAALGLLKRALPYLFAAAVGASLAWWAQGVRVTAARQEFAQYKIDSAGAAVAHGLAAEKQRKETADDFSKKRQELQAQIDAGDVFRRCVAAGKCGVRVERPVCASSGLRLPPAGGTDAASANAVPARGEPAAQVTDPVVVDCAVTTLLLNKLQADVERQVGY